MKYKPEQVLALLLEVDQAAVRAVGPHPDLTIGERLDLWHHVDSLRSNRYDVLAQAYRELLDSFPQPTGDRISTERLWQCRRILRRMVEWDAEGKALHSVATDLLAEVDRQLAKPDRQWCDITLYEKQTWLRSEHGIHIVIDREGLDSDEMCYVYEVTYHKPEDKGTKHWVGALTRVKSFQVYVGSYSGGWDTYEQALAAAIEFGLTLIEKP